MQYKTDKEFLEWTESKSILLNEEFDNSKPLIFSSPNSTERIWLPPKVPSDLPGFITTILNSASEQGSFWVYRRGGGNWFEGDDTPIDDQIRDHILLSIGVNKSFEGAIGFEIQEWKTMLLLIISFYICGWNIGDNLQIIPEDGSCIVETSHHGQVFVRFKDVNISEKFIKKMQSERFQVQNTSA